MKYPIIIVAGIWISWELMDFYASEILPSIIAPMALVFFVAWLVGWLIYKLRFGFRSDEGCGPDPGDFGGDGGGD